MTREELAKAIEELSKKDQIWLIDHILWRIWPEFKEKPVGFYDPKQYVDNWDDDELGKEYEELYRAAGVVNTEMTTQLQPTPTLYGEDAIAIIEQIKEKPTENQLETVEERHALFAKIRRGLKK